MNPESKKAARDFGVRIAPIVYQSPTAEDRRTAMALDYLAEALDEMDRLEAAEQTLLAAGRVYAGASNPERMLEHFVDHAGCVPGCMALEAITDEMWAARQDFVAVLRAAGGTPTDNGIPSEEKS